MLSVNETAYPRFKTNSTPKDLDAIYTPNPEEISLANGQTQRKRSRVGFLVLLKTFQRLGYFPKLTDVPLAIISHITICMKIPEVPRDLANYVGRMQFRHMNQILKFLKVTAYDKAAESVMQQAMILAAATKDDVADIVNVAIEELIRQRFELPGFNVLVRAAKKARFKVNNGYFRLLYQILGSDKRIKIDALLKGTARSVKSSWDRIKQEPKRPSIGNIHEFTSQLQFLVRHDLGEQAFSVLPDIKLRQFAAEARSLDAASMRDLALHKRYALAAALIRVQTGRAIDDLAEIFVKRMQKLHRQGKEALDAYHLKQVDQTHSLIAMLRDVIIAACKSEASAQERLNTVIAAFGTDPDKILEQCESFGAHADNNYLPFLPRFYKAIRHILFALLEAVALVSTSSDTSIARGISFLLQNRRIKGEWLQIHISQDLDWVSDKWWPLVSGGASRNTAISKVSRRYFELCLFTQVMQDLKSGDLAVIGGDKYADYRSQLIHWDDYKKELPGYGQQVGIDIDAQSFVDRMRRDLSAAALKTDHSFPKNQYARFEAGELVLSKFERRTVPKDFVILDKLLSERIPQINIVDVLADTDHWLGWSRHFKPLSGYDAKIENPRMRYIATTFCYGCNLGPSQTARSIKGLDRRQVSLVNQRHSTVETLEKAIVQVINAYNNFSLPKIWGSGKRAAADGTKWDLYEQNLLSEYHIRYGGYGGIGYYHVSDNYIALFSRFIPCGVWEGIYILDGPMQNHSDIQPDTIHGDTQAQSAPVFALAHLLGIQLMPRIRNWKDLKLFRPDANVHYKNIDSIFSEAIDWQLIKTHFPDMMRVAVSIKMGKLTPSTILRRLGTYNRKNKLYFAFRELGRVVRTIFLLKYINDAELRQTINATTNKCEAFNGFTKWVAFGGDGVIAENGRDEQRKIIKYNHLVSSLLIVHNVDSMTKVLDLLREEGHEFGQEALEMLSPYRTEHINRFGDYTLDLDKRPQPLSDSVSVKFIPITS